MHFTPELKIKFLKVFNLHKGGEFATDEFCYALRLFAYDNGYSKYRNAAYYFPELWDFYPIRSRLVGILVNYRWFPFTEEGDNERHNICNILLAELENNTHKLDKDLNPNIHIWIR